MVNLVKMVILVKWLIGYLSGPSGPGAVPRCGLREMSVYYRLLAVYVCLLANIRVF